MLESWLENCPVYPLNPAFDRGIDIIAAAGAPHPTTATGTFQLTSLKPFRSVGHRGLQDSSIGETVTMIVKPSHIERNS